MKGHVNTYQNGMNQDTAPSKYPNTQYFDAKNFRLLTNRKGLSAGSRISQNGNELQFKIPKLQEVSLTSTGTTQVAYVQFTFSNGQTANLPATNLRTDTEDNFFTDLKEALNNGFIQADVIRQGSTGYIYIQDGNFDQEFASVAILLNVGNTQVPEITIGNTIEDYKINGYSTSRNYLTLITSNSTDSIIWTVNYESSNIIQHKYKGDLELLDTEDTFAKLYYENERSLKLYWGRESVFLRSCNLFDEQLMLKNKNDFNLVRDVNTSKINILNKITGGTFKAGVVQYAYSLYDLYGKESNVIGVSDLAAVDDLSTTLGNKLDEDLNVAFTGRIENLDTRFTHIKIYRLHYTVPGVNPAVTRIIDEQFNSEYSTNNDKSITFSDDGQKIISAETLEKIRNLSKDNFKAWDIESKDGILFAFNIENDFFDVDIDTRAYSFEESSTSLNLYTSNNTLDQYTINNGSLVSNDWDNIAIDHDSINPDYWNSSTGSEEKGKQYIASPNQYKHNSIVKGGSGKYISYSFTTTHPEVNNEPLVIDDNTNPLSGTNYVESITPGRFTGSKYTGQDKSFRNSLLVDLRGHMRGEIYRYAIRYRNTNGKFTPAKWIADIQIPTDIQQPVTLNGQTIQLNNLYIDFSVYIPQSLIDQGVTGYEILRVERENKDKTILAEGLLTFAIKDDAGDKPSLHPYHLEKCNIGEFENGLTTGLLGAQGTSLGTAQKHVDCIQFYSPEVAFDDNFKPEDIELVLSGLATNSRFTTGNQAARELHKFINYADISLDSEDGVLKIQQVENIKSSLSPINAIEENTLVSSLNWVYENYLPNKVNTISQNGGVGATHLLLKTEDTRQDVMNKIATHYSYTSNSLTHPIAKIVTKLVSQYNGNTLEARSYNQYIPASDIVPVTSSGTYDTVSKRGDIFIGGYELYRKMIYVENDTSNEPYGAGTSGLNSFNNMEFAYIPMCSTYNIDKKSSKGYWTGLSRVYALRELKEQFQFVSQIMNAWENADVDDAYEIHNVYSKVNNEIVSEALPFKFNPITTFDSLIKWSDTKSQNELIDSWSEFKYGNEYNKLDTDSGKGTSLTKINDQIFFTQERAFGMLLINPRYTQSNGQGVEISIGKGTTLADHKYYDQKNGALHRMSVCSGDSSILYYNSYNGILYQFNGKVTPLSIVKGMHSYFTKYNELLHRSFNTDKHNPLNSQGVSITFNNIEKSFYITTKAIYNQETVPVIGGAGSNATQIENYYYKDNIEFSELDDSFISRYDFYPDFTINFNDLLFTSNQNNNSIWKHSENAIPCNYYGEQFSNSISFIINPNSSFISTFDILDYKSVVFEKSQASTQQIFPTWTEVQETFNKVRASNDYQDSQQINADVTRLQRAWRIHIPYDTDNVRMRDVYVKIDLEYDNDGKLMVLDDLLTKYRDSQY